MSQTNKENPWEIAHIRRVQEERMARQSWEYLNQNDPLYPEIIVQRGNRDALGNLLSVSEACKKLKRKALYE